jgi:hypothetical protein
MTNKRSYSIPFSSLVIVGLIALLCFMVIGPSIFISGIIGIAIAATSSFVIGILGAITRKTRPSPLWTASIIGSCIGLLISILYVREMNLHTRTFINQWTIIIIPITATMGSVIASTEIVKEVIDNIFTDLNELK